MQIIMVDKIIVAILKAEEQAHREISEASTQAEKMKADSNVPQDEIFNNMLASCRKEAEESIQLARQKAKDRSKKIMDECEDEVAKLRALDEKTLIKAAEMILKEITHGGTQS